LERNDREVSLRQFRLTQFGEAEKTMLSVNNAAGAVGCGQSYFDLFWTIVSRCWIIRQNPFAVYEDRVRKRDYLPTGYFLLDISQSTLVQSTLVSSAITQPPGNVTSVE
jgi:hypothetical protein